MEDKLPSLGQARVMSVTRRSLQILVEKELWPAIASQSTRDVVVGDTVEFSRRGSELFIENVLPRKNCLTRTYQATAKHLAANLDKVLVVCSVKPLFQPLFIDRILAACRIEQIPALMIVNKSDLGLDETTSLMKIYEAIGLDILITSAKFGDGLDNLEKCLAAPELEVVALAGVSGVGKSTILNRLVPGALQATGEVRARSGQGRQTTTQASGYLYCPPSGAHSLILIDLPGVQNFGVGHLPPELLTHGFVEIEQIGGACEFDNCSHVGEARCAVKAAVAEGTISESRYQSYLKMREEVTLAKRY